MKKEFIKRVISSIILIPMSFFLIINGDYLFKFFIFICFLIASYEWINISPKKIFKICGLIFLLISFFSIYKLRYDLSGDYRWLLFITIICVSTDIGGYVFGKIFKGPKLSRFSPKKTYAGALGAYFLSILIVNFFMKDPFFNEYFKTFNEIILFTLLISTISQFGDIVISYFKRLSKMKDTGNIIPGHGGLLDRIDGMIFAFPFSYYIVLQSIIL